MSDPRFTAKTPCPTCEWRGIVASYYGLVAAQARRIAKSPTARAAANRGQVVIGDASRSEGCRGASPL